MCYLMGRLYSFEESNLEDEDYDSDGYVHGIEKRMLSGSINQDVKILCRIRRLSNLLQNSE